jgi:hypothetical protein
MNRNFPQFACESIHAVYVNLFMQDLEKALFPM